MQVPNTLLNNTVADADEVMANFNFLSLLVTGLPRGTMLNGKLSVTDTGSGLQVGLKTFAGTDPTTADPVYVRIGDTWRSVTAALTRTLADGTNWMNAGSAELATKEIDYFVYAVWDSNSSAVGLSFARIPSANLVSDFSATTTNEKYCAGQSDFTATDEVEVAGRFAATLSAGAGYTWSVPTYTAINLIQRPIYETRFLTATSANPTNCTVVTRYKVSNNEVFCEMRGTMTGTPSWATRPGLPFSVGASVLSGDTDYSACGVGGYLDNGTANVVDGLTPILGPSVSVLRIDGNATSAIVSATSPITWATNDVWYVRFTYEI